MRIWYTTVRSPMGRLLVAASERGICTVSVGNSDAVLESALIDEYMAAEIQRDSAGLSKYVTALLRHLEGKELTINFPLDIQTTAFQWMVYEALRKIPYGQTCTYGEIAETLGRPNAVRAVARACAINPVALVIPCHRVVRKDGTLAGYRWGICRKKKLLAHEIKIRRKTNPSGITI